MRRVCSLWPQGPGRDQAVTSRNPPDKPRLLPRAARLTDDGGAECVGQQRQPVVIGFLQRVHRPWPWPRVQQQALQLAQHLQPALPLGLALGQQQHGAHGGRHGQLGGRHLRAGAQAGGLWTNSRPSPPSLGRCLLAPLGAVRRPAESCLPAGDLPGRTVRLAHQGQSPEPVPQWGGMGHGNIQQDPGPG